MRIILAAEKKISLAEKSERLKSSAAVFKNLSLAQKKAHP